MSYTIIDPLFTFSRTVKTDQIKQCVISTLTCWSDGPYISERTILDQIKLQYVQNVTPVIIRDCEQNSTELITFKTKHMLFIFCCF